MNCETTKHVRQKQDYVCHKSIKYKLYSNENILSIAIITAFFYYKF